MENIAELALEKLKNLSEINDLGTRSLHLQNLSLFLLKNRNKLKIELNYPVFWFNLESLLEQSQIQSQAYDTDLDQSRKKLLLHNKLNYQSFEADLIAPSDLVLYLSNELMKPSHKKLLEVLCSHSAIYLSLNLVLNLPE